MTGIYYMCLLQVRMSFVINEDNLKYQVNLKYEDHLKYEDNLKYEDKLK